MATSSSSSSSLLLPNINFNSRQSPTITRSVSIAGIFLPRNRLSYNHNLRIRTRLIRASKDDNVAVEDRDNAVKINGDYNGSARLNGNGSARKSVNGDFNGSARLNGNGSLVKYVNGSVTVETEEVTKKRKEEVRKKRVEDIGQEDAWFKNNTQQKQVEVSVTPGGRWNRFKTYSTIQRTLEIWGFVVQFIFRTWLSNKKFSYKGGMTEEKKVLRRKVLAKWLKENILRLGPTFIKIGQQFSTRVDILPQEYVDQLSELQDQVPPFPSATALSIVEEELGGSVEDIFDRFDYEPIAAASLGQVHRARLKGQEVVLKVQRPGLKDLFDIDLKNLRVIAEYLQKVDPKSDGAKRDWVAIYDECASVLYQEIDYTKEAANSELFANNFKDLEYVKVPSIYWEYTTPQVLTMEYVPGIKINKIQALDQLGVDRKRLGRYAVESYLEQILSHGFFHADPHPGNIAVDDVNGGRLIFYDFGMMGSISPNIREGLLEAFYGVYEKDPDKVLQAMVQMGVLVPTGDLTAVRRTALFFLNSFEERLAAQRKEKEEIAAAEELGFKKPLSKEEKQEKKKQRLAAIGEDLLAIAADQPFRFPATFTFVVRAFSVLDGIGKGLDPRFDITEIAKPYALELLRFREAGVEVVVKDLRKRWDRQSQAFYNLFRQADRVEKLAVVIERLEQGDLKLRVRALESERAFQRVAAVQKTVGSAVAAGSLVNLATILYLNSIKTPATIAYTVCAFFSLQVLIGIIKVKKFDQREKLITGTA
ncbi:Protein ACTIVITY OF BC1 COMPLEX KINASE 8 [Arabidopsis thaliana]|uniref:Protein ACTIVITY OF BC1 COMPLEX KINASE 8, chloroplastic n=4 Tax=Arabidopsis TaxID=3701 RepID=AB1K8_ARATH|nr:ABC2 homolog 13 [Arabidopsis thaliana]NP_851271.1 ABC2 homolog 13 [Arabidopsis thaliana]Q93Y08.1 RecName: Full=Protein ACTIVITY OF BC1 COMPLEX KINASE 8, chloroplastic; Short=ABC1-LIKE KINASE 8; AltName: Full=ABC2 homolog protein 13; Short=AtATH13; AltName: Full=Oxidative stress-related ABC1-like protein 1, chloroplastic; Short=AtOSA1; Flags: Precursor [Arabidopsis thaliana]KAG7607333.1 Protein kinase-like domain superfamily [Arabidopsis thaliana x Arabidopsis arenosa]KAG7614236.1 Protein kin|eukprot:NP_201299.2 ABC2 homolog 13 [Arabidopsis thaliana]